MPDDSLANKKPDISREHENTFARDTLEIQIGTVIEAMKDRNINGHYCESKEGLPDLLEELIPSGSSVGLGGTVTLMETGALEMLRERVRLGEITMFDRYGEGLSAGEINAMRKASLTTDVFISGTNAVTRDGVLVNADGIGNRVAAHLYGPSRVIILTGANKIVADLEEAISRVRNVATPMNAHRFGVDTPCSHTGFCPTGRCPPTRRLDKKYTIIEAEHDPDRFHVIFLNGCFGF